MKKLNSFLKRAFICRGRHNPIYGLRDNGIIITKYFCANCESTLGLGRLKFYPKPPNSNYTQEEYNEIVMKYIHEDYAPSEQDIINLRNYRLKKLI